MRYGEKARDVQQAALLTIGSADSALAAECLCEAISLPRARGCSPRATRSLRYPTDEQDFPVWLVELDRSAPRCATGEMPVMATWFPARSGESDVWTDALTCDEAAAAAYLLAGMDEVWLDEVLEACAQARAGWRPADEAAAPVVNAAAQAVAS